jgi:DNA polymerase-3 subunit alpha
MTEDNQELLDYFRYQCEKGFESRGFNSLPAEKKKQYRDRLEYEIEVITKMGFVGYFLIVQDIILWCKRNGIPSGPGRGSIGGSLVAYCMDITEVDPIQYDLIFERFLNPGRVGEGSGGLCDIDMDFSREHRDQVLEYVAGKYGQDCVCRIGTFGLMRAKNAIKNVARVLGHDYAVGDKLSKMLLAPIHGKQQSLKTSIEKVPELKEHYNKDGAYGQILHIAEKFEGLVNNVGVHAAGLIIAPQSIGKSIPMFLGKDGEVTAQWEMNNLEDIGYIKFDFLGLDTLTRIYYALEFIKERHNIDLDINNIDRKDPKVFEEIRTGNTAALFQLEQSSGIQDLTLQVRPTKLEELEDLSAILAVYRPGPLDSPGLSDYLACRAGEKEPEYLFPELEPILSDTSGFLIYQESIIRMAVELAGYDLATADDLRKAMGKKIQKKMDKHEPKFKQGCAKSKLDPDRVNQLWKQVQAFAAYGFNRAHSMEYGLITYQTAYLKTYYPVEWMCSAMICDADNKDQMIKYISECRRMGITISPPDINRSQNTFSIDSKDRIVFGLSPIRNLGEGPVNGILEERESGGKYKDLTDFLTRVNLSKINKLKVQSLVKSGCFDFTECNRNSLLVGVDRYWDYKNSFKPYESKLATYYKRKEKCAQRLKDIEEGKTKAKPLKDPVLPERPEAPSIPSLPEQPIDERLKEERHLLGYYINEHPLDFYDLRGQMQIDRVKQLTDSGEIHLACVVAGKQEITTKKKKQKMAFLTLEDQTGQIEAIAFAKTYATYSKLFESGDPLFIYGYLEVTKGETDNLCKIRIGKVKELSSAARKLPKKKTRLMDLLIKSDKVDNAISWLKVQKDGTIEVRPVIELSSGNRVTLSKVFKVDKDTIGSVIGVSIEQEMGRSRRKVS